jgi:tol-pal system beta propeller repeat protein TolB
VITLRAVLLSMVAAAFLTPVSAADPVPGLGSKIAFVTDRGGRDAPDELYVTNGRGNGDLGGDERLVFAPESGNALFPDWSPNGQAIAFHNFAPEIGGPEIFVVNVDGTGLAQLTHMTALGLGALNPSWSPDGTRIAFNSAVNPHIYVINADGTGLTRLTDDAADESRPDWSPNGRRIAFDSIRSGDREIYVTDANGTGDPVRLTDATGADMGADWSPNGRRIAFERDLGAGNREIFVTDAVRAKDEGTGERRLTTNQVLDAFPAWSPDGHWIAFHRQVVQLPGLAAPNGSELFAISADGSRELQLTHNTPGSFSAFASWAPGHASELP